MVVTGTVAAPLTDPYGNERIGLAVSTTVDRTEFGVAVNAADDPVLVPYTGWPDPVGPTVLAYNRGGDPFAAVTLPSLSDRQDRRAAMRILAAVVPALSAPKTAD